VANEPGHRAFQQFEAGVIGTEEGYEIKVRVEAIWRLDAGSWTEAQIGSGEILARVIDAIEIEGSKLVRFEARNGLRTEGPV
jgi:hypothetical protein